MLLRYTSVSDLFIPGIFTESCVMAELAVSTVGLPFFEFRPLENQIWWVKHCRDCVKLDAGRIVCACVVRILRVRFEKFNSVNSLAALKETLLDQDFILSELGLLLAVAVWLAIIVASTEVEWAHPAVVFGWVHVRKSDANWALIVDFGIQHRNLNTRLGYSAYHIVGSRWLIGPVA